MASMTQSASLVKVAVPTARKTVVRRAAVKVQANVWPVSYYLNPPPKKNTILPSWFLRMIWSDHSVFRCISTRDSRLTT